MATGDVADIGAVLTGGDIGETLEEGTETEVKGGEEAGAASEASS